LNSPKTRESRGDDTLDVLVVGAGPTGLTLAAQLSAFGVRFRLIDRALDRAHESRALGVQARSLEILQTLGLGDELVARGNRSAKITLHVDGRVAASAELGSFTDADTRYPFILFVSQAETEAVLVRHLASRDVQVERGVALQSFVEEPSGVLCTLGADDGSVQHVRARYLVGCDGAHSTVRQGANIPFEGDAYLQDFMLGDVEINADPALAPDSIHPFVGRAGIAMIFPLGKPTTWRVIAMSARSAAASGDAKPGPDRPLTSALSLEELQTVVDGATGGGVHVRDPAWLTHFHLHHRQASHYRSGRIFLAGDAAHIHSPVGAQGMNTGIQDAWNLGWKLALVVRGADERLLDSYEAERWPVGRTLLRYTDRAFSLVLRSLSAGRVASWLRRTVPGLVVPLVLSIKPLRAIGFRFVSELGIHYRRSPIVVEGTPSPRGGAKAGDRLPDAPVVKDGRATWLQAEVVGPRFHLLLCGPPAAWDRGRVDALTQRFRGCVAVSYLTTSSDAEALVDTTGEAHRRLGHGDTMQFLVRPDGHIGFRCGGTDLDGASAFLRATLTQFA
jgi:2-polyprenyl-6-methoxyphenol hydroxylase-like FAD-dependent oxidoreductase